MIRTDFLQETNDKKIIERKKHFTIVEYQRDISVTPETAISAYYAGQMNVRKRQAVVELSGSDVILQAGAMQWMAGAVEVATNVKGVGDFAKKLIGSKVTNESAIKPRYHGSGLLVLEPTYRHLLLEDLSDWDGGMVIEDGLFLACDGSVNMKTVARSTFSSAALGNEGLFNSMMTGSGLVLLESQVPREELVMVEIENDVLRIDGSYAIAWSHSLKFTVERTTKTLIGSAASGEGLVNVYRGTGKVLMAPIM